MPKRANKSRRVNQQGHRKLKKGTNSSNIFSQLATLLPLKHRKKLYRGAESLFKFVGQYCCKIGLAPFSIDTATSKYVIKQSVWEMKLHYLLLALQVTWMLNQLTSALIHVNVKGMDLPGVLCTATCMTSVIGLSVPASLLFKRQETMELLNTMPKVMQYYPKTGKILPMFENFELAVVAWAIAAIGAVVAVVVSILNFIVPVLPGSLYWYLNMTGIPGIYPGVSSTVWKILIWPGEFFVAFQSMMLCIWSGTIMLALPMLTVNWTRSLRKVPVNTSEGWKELQWHYLLCQTFIKSWDSWMQFMIIPTLASVGGSIVITLYITMKHPPGIPMILYLAIAYVGFADLFMFFWVNLVLMNVVSATGSIQETLQATTRQSFLGLYPDEKQYLKKAARASRPAVIRVGDLMDHSSDVPIGVWDEILNQLFFLLSL